MNADDQILRIASNNLQESNDSINAKKINVSYCKLDLNANIISFNDDFINMFNLRNKNIKDMSIKSVANLSIDYQILNGIGVGNKKSFMLFINTKINQNMKYNAMSIVYILVSRQKNHYSIRMVNWLNWLHNIAESLEHGYTLMSKFNDSISKNKFRKISDASCYKALYPLITYIPKKFSNGVSQISLFEIMRVFVKQRNELKFTKDYARNIYSRIRTNLRQEYNLESTDVIDLIKNKDLVNINFNGEIYILHTVLVKNIIFLIEHDTLLILTIEALCPDN